MSQGDRKEFSVFTFKRIPSTNLTRKQKRVQELIMLVQRSILLRFLLDTSDFEVFELHDVEELEPTLRIFTELLESVHPEHPEFSGDE